MQSDFFNHEELNLLSSISDDINFALNAIEAEKTRKEAEEALLESENRYNTFVNNNVDMIFVKDENLKYLMANNAMADFFGKSIEEILHKTDAEIVGFDLFERFRSDNRFCLRPYPASEDVGLKTSPDKQLSLKQSVRHIGRFLFSQVPDYRFCRRTAVDINKIVLFDKSCRILPDPFLLRTVQIVLLKHIGFFCPYPVFFRSSASVDLCDQAFLIERRQIPANCGFGCPHNLTQFFD